MSEQDDILESQTIATVIAAARQIQEFLWGEMNDDVGLEEVRRMVRKRVAKLDAVSTDNPHWRIEVKKRLLQLGAIAVNFITQIENGKLTETGVHPTLPSNLPDYATPIDESPDAEMTKGLEIQALSKKSHCPDCNRPSFDDHGCTIYQQAEQIRAKDEELRKAYGRITALSLTAAWLSAACG